MNSKVLKEIMEREREGRQYYETKEDLKFMIEENSRLNYLCNYNGFSVTNHHQVTYYPLGELVFKEMLKDLKKAKKYIFLEYFIIKPGVMWDSILQILEEKVKEGVEVRVMYDDAGCLANLKKQYDEELRQKGIKCIVFNPLTPLSGVIMNNRDHRKILIIDGKFAFSGGINLSDEYINRKSPYGHWKDNGIKIEGEAVWDYTVMFLTMWNAFQKEDTDFKIYQYKRSKKYHANGVIVPYADSPLDKERVGENLYLLMIHRAEKTIFIFTPYLIIDTDMITALILAAKRGVDVRIIIPGIPDKKIVYTLSESYLEMLVNGGVKVYKYTHGFIHSKVFVIDGHMATVGTINLDYRSLYLHFECGLYLEDVDCIKEIQSDLEKTTAKSHQITKREATPKFLKSIWQTILRLFAPLF